MIVTVAICTWNRAKMLDQTLVQMAKLRIPQGIEWELLVVDNNSTDETTQVLTRHLVSKVLPLRVVVERKQGQSNARNRAIDEAQGEMILWTDDDVLVHSEWLSSYVKAAKDWPTMVYFGGRIDPWFSCDPPSWIKANISELQAPFAIRNLSESTRVLLRHEDPYGANLGFRTAVLRKERFNPDLGLIGKKQTRGDETEMLLRLYDQGYRGVWVHDAIVDHYIPPERLTAEYIWGYHNGGGRAIRIMDGAIQVPTLMGMPRYAIRAYLQSAIVEMILRPFKSSRWVRSLIRSAYYKGYLSQCSTQVREPSREMQ